MRRRSRRTLPGRMRVAEVDCRGWCPLGVEHAGPSQRPGPRSAARRHCRGSVVIDDAIAVSYGLGAMVGKSGSPPSRPAKIGSPVAWSWPRISDTIVWKECDPVVTTTTSVPNLEVYTDHSGRRYVVDDRLPPGEMQYVIRVTPRTGLRIWVEFRNGTNGEVDLSAMAKESAVVGALWSDRDYFETVHVPDYGGVAWEGERFDISPLVLYMMVTSNTLEEVCPQVRFLD